MAVVFFLNPGKGPIYFKATRKRHKYKFWMLILKYVKVHNFQQDFAI